MRAKHPMCGERVGRARVRWDTVGRRGRRADCEGVGSVSLRLAGAPWWCVGERKFMRWLRNAVVATGLLGGMAVMAGGCDYDDHDYHHDRYYRERPVAYRVEPERHWDHDRD